MFSVSDSEWIINGCGQERRREKTYCPKHQPSSATRTICGNQFIIFGLARMQIAVLSTDPNICRKPETEKICGKIVPRQKVTGQNTRYYVQILVKPRFYLPLQNPKKAQFDPLNRCLSCAGTYVPAYFFLDAVTQRRLVLTITRYRNRS